MKSVLLLLLLLPAFVFPQAAPKETAEPQLAGAGETIPFEVTPKAPVEGDLVIIRVKSAAKVVNWVLPKVQQTKDGTITLADCPVKVDPNEAGLKLVLAAPRLPPGVRSQEFQFVAIADGQIGSLILVVTSATPVAPIIPPKPPDVPTPPAPTDTFAAEIRKAYAGDADQDKKTAAKNLASLYKAAAEEAKDKSLMFVGDLQDWLAATVEKSTTLKLKDKLPDVRARVRAEVVKILVDVEAPLTDGDGGSRAKAIAVYAAAAKALEDAAK